VKLFNQSVFSLAKDQI